MRERFSVDGTGGGRRPQKARGLLDYSHDPLATPFVFRGLRLAVEILFIEHGAAATKKVRLLQNQVGTASARST